MEPEKKYIMISSLFYDLQLNNNESNDMNSHFNSLVYQFQGHDMYFVMFLDNLGSLEQLKQCWFLIKFFIMDFYGKRQRLTYITYILPIMSEYININKKCIITSVKI